MKKLRKILLWSLIIIVLFILQGFFLMYLYQDNIKKIAVTQLNKQLNTPINVNKIQFSVFQHFPFASISFSEVEILGSLKEEKNNLLAAKEVSLLFNVWDLYNKTYQIKKLYLENATIHIKTDKSGQVNYSIWKVKNESNEEFNFSIDEIIFVNSTIHYQNQQLKKDFNLLIFKGTSSGKFSEKAFNQDLDLEGELKSITLDTNTYLRNKKIKINTSLNVNLNNSIYNFQKIKIVLEEITLDGNGIINYSENSKHIDFTINGSNATLQSFILLLPKTYQEKFKNYQSTGEFYFHSKINGSIAENKNPKISLQTGINNGEFRLEALNNKELFFKKVNFKLNFTNGVNKNIESAIVTIPTFNAELENNPLSLSLVCTNLKEPYIELKLKSKVKVQDIQLYLPKNSLTLESGHMNIDADFKGQLSDFQNIQTISKTSANGKIALENLSLRLYNSSLTVKELNGNFIFTNNDLRINQLKAIVGKSDIELTGYFRNLLAFILFPEQDLEIETRLKSNNFYLAELLSSTPTSNSNNDYLIKINRYLKSSITLAIDNLYFNRFKAQNVEGALEINDQIIRTNYLSFRAQNGLVFSKINLNAKNQDKIEVAADFNLKQIDIQKLFYEFEDFGLDIIKSTNIKGIATASLKTNSTWNKNLQANLNDIYVTGPVLIENGELKNFEPLLALAKYIDVNELQNLKFATLENTLTIKNQILEIPLMKISNNALNIDFSGTHTFDNIIDYRIKMLLSDLVKRKSKKLGDEKFAEIEEDGRGKTVIYLRMYGDVYNPKFSLDKVGIKKKLSDDFKQEGKEVKQVLKDEYKSWFTKENEYKEKINTEPAEWESDIPGKSQNLADTKKSTVQKNDTLLNKKTKFQKLKEKLKEPIEEEQP